MTYKLIVGVSPPHQTQDLECEPDVFHGKTILLSYDDLEWSNFPKFFDLHFVDLEHKKLVLISYVSYVNQALPPAPRHCLRRKYPNAIV